MVLLNEETKLILNLANLGMQLTLIMIKLSKIRIIWLKVVLAITISHGKPLPTLRLWAYSFFKSR